MNGVTTILVWSLVVILGITMGAGLYESIIVYPTWTNSGPEQWIETGRPFWALFSTVPLTILLLASAAILLRYRGPAWKWLLACTVILAVERAATYGYFIPNMVWMQQQESLTPEVQSSLSMWGTANSVRHILHAAAWILALLGLWTLARYGPPDRHQSSPSSS